ncbi:MAG: hypothetical protein KAS32_03775 [Candidatus Peribacteraceae bacterium]|nr:hypothetical protein [Candidatus Peribacteraceae bacterium]
MDDNLSIVKKYLIRLHGIEEYEERIKDIRDDVKDAEFMAYRSGDSMVKYHDRLFAHVAMDGFVDVLAPCVVKDEELESL